MLFACMWEVWEAFLGKKKIPVGQGINTLTHIATLFKESHGGKLGDTVNLSQM